MVPLLCRSLSFLSSPPLVLFRTAPKPSPPLHLIPWRPSSESEVSPRPSSPPLSPFPLAESSSSKRRAWQRSRRWASDTPGTMGSTRRVESCSTTTSVFPYTDLIHTSTRGQARSSRTELAFIRVRPGRAAELQGEQVRDGAYVLPRHHSP
jgi:hypothetical protein